MLDFLNKEHIEVFWKDNEMHIWDNIFNRLYFYDFTIKNIKMIIEFNGHHCHPSPVWTDLNLEEQLINLVSIINEYEKQNKSI